MRISTRILIAPLLIGSTGLPVLGAQSAPARATADSVPISVRWNRLVPKFADEAAAARRAARKAAAGDSVALRRLSMMPPPMLFRVYTLLSTSQYAAANSTDNRAASPEAAIAAASAAVLSAQFPDSAVRASISRELARDLERAGMGSARANRALAGRRAGEDAAARVLAWAPPLDFAAGANLAIPTGRGMWYSAQGSPPMGTFFGKSRTWLLDSASQYRPAPPPAFDSPEFRNALDEVRHVVRQLTPEQLRIARRWSLADPWAVWNETASVALVRNRVPEAQAARVLAVLNAAASDAVIACFEAKYQYWTIRPSQADTTLVIPDSIGLPNFPAYPSGHACSAGAFETVMAHFLPQERAGFNRIAEEQAMARLYGGVHYRFDNDTGLALGRTVARHAVEAERRGKWTPVVGPPKNKVN